MLTTDPLAAPPADSPAAGLFLRHFGIERQGDPEQLLAPAAEAFSKIPYENLTKILKHSREGSAERSRRGPLEVVSDHISLGSGGTCFSLTAAFLHVARALGVRAEPILADRAYGANTHTALLAWLGGRPHLLDPGFLITRPVPLDLDGETRIRTAFNDIVLTPRDGGAKVDLYTVQGSSSGSARTYRLTFKAEPADPSAFLRAWDASFEWDMMRYPLLTRVAGDSQLYVQGSRWQTRTRAGARRREMAPQEVAGVISREFGIDPGIAARALEVLRRSGEAP